MVYINRQWLGIAIQVIDLTTPILYKIYNIRKSLSLFLAKPGLLDFTGKAKWEAWNHKLGTSQDKAKQDYVNKAQDLISKIGLA